MKVKINKVLSDTMKISELVPTDCFVYKPTEFRVFMLTDKSNVAIGLFDGEVQPVNPKMEVYKVLEFSAKC